MAETNCNSLAWHGFKGVSVGGTLACGKTGVKAVIA